MMTGPDRQPWEHEGVRIEGGRLLVAGRDAEELAREHGTPLYVFDVTRVAEQARALRDALARAGLTPRVRLALKAQRAPEVLAALRALGAPGSPGAVGIDACSPGEVLHALDNGFTAAEISFTGTNVSERDLDVLVPAGVHLNLDLLTQIERYGRRRPGTSIGLRVNPRGGVMRGRPESLYSGARPTKFGIYEEDLDAAVAAARRHDLAVDTLHVHLANAHAGRRAARVRRRPRAGGPHGGGPARRRLPARGDQRRRRPRHPDARRRAAARPRRLRRHPRAPLRRARRGGGRRARRVPHQRERRPPRRGGHASSSVWARPSSAWTPAGTS